jgi:hypothetical protein
METYWKVATIHLISKDEGVKGWNLKKRFKDCSKIVDLDVSPGPWQLIFTIKVRRKNSKPSLKSF